MAVWSFLPSHLNEEDVFSLDFRDVGEFSFFEIDLSHTTQPTLFVKMGWHITN